MPRSKRITKSQSIGLYDGLEEEVQKFADEHFGGNVNLAMNKLITAGLKATEGKALEGWGGKQADTLRTAMQNEKKFKAGAQA